jgi:peptidoglycan/LPS O-acetylase OafA/YrhL
VIAVPETPLETTAPQTTVRPTGAGSPDGVPVDRLRYVPALDGIRAVSIIGIMANHGGLGWANGGFISVNVFFVLSGFLITSLLAKEWLASGTISLRRFWARRARRLLPALLVLLVGVAFYAWLIAPPSTRSALRGDGLATLFYVANWHQILTSQSYFSQTAFPSPLLHTWTLAIEEQFYLVWPLVVLGILKWRRSLRPLLVVSVVGALVSAAWMAHLYHAGSDPSRLYYGTDTRAQDLLVGAAMAILLVRRPPAATARGRLALSTMTVAAMIGFALEWSRLNASSGIPYRFGFLLADVLVALVIAGVFQVPGSLPARALGWRPLAYIGTISYGLYLWHWPVFVVLDHQRTGLSGLTLFALRCAVSFVIAVLSSRFVELPIRRGLGHGWRAWVLAPAAVGVAAVALLVATVEPSAGVAFGGVSAPVRPGGPPVRSLIVGDSIALTLFYGMLPKENDYGVSLELGGHVGCGVATTLPLEDHGVVGEPFPDCQDWPSWWSGLVAKYDPQVVAIMVGRWEAMNRMYDGKWQHLGDPQFDAYVQSQLERGVGIVSARGAKVVLFTAPYFDSGEQPDGQPWPEDDPARVDVYNRIVQAVAARHPGLITVIPLNRYLDPDGHFTWTIDGQVVRQGDGVHNNFAGGLYLAPRILPTLAAVGRQSSVPADLPTSDTPTTVPGATPSTVTTTTTSTTPPATASPPPSTPPAAVSPVTAGSSARG